jgi:hypothetical protein
VQPLDNTAQSFDLRFWINSHLLTEPPGACCDRTSERSFEGSPERRPALSTPRSAPARRRRNQKPLEGLNVFDAERRELFAVVDDCPKQEPLGLLAVGTMSFRAAVAVRIMLGGQPGGDGLIVVPGLEQALLPRRPGMLITAVELG